VVFLKVVVCTGGGTEKKPGKLITIMEKGGVASLGGTGEPGVLRIERGAEPELHLALKIKPTLKTESFFLSDPKGL